MLYLERKKEEYLKPLKPEFVHLINNSTAGQAMQKLLDDYSFDTVLDVGFGPGLHIECFEKANKIVYGLDYNKHRNFDASKFSRSTEFLFSDLMDIDFEQEFDCIWCSHVLEHQLECNGLI